jgi:hypothetical protein
VVDGVIRTPNNAGAEVLRTNIKISDFRIDCARSLARDVYSAIDLVRVDDVEIRDMICHNGENFGITVEWTNRCTISGCHVYDFNDNANSNGITVTGDHAHALTTYGATITGNVVEDIGTIGIDIFGMSQVAVTGNSIRSCLYGVSVEGANTAGGAVCRDLVISNNTFVGTTDLNELPQEQNNVGITLWLRDTAAGLDTSLLHYNIVMSGNTFRDYKRILTAGGGHWLFTGNEIYGWGLGLATDVSALEIGTVYGTAIKLSNIAITNNYFTQQGFRATVGTTAAIDFIGGTNIVNNVIIKGNIFNGMDLTADDATVCNQHGLLLRTVGSNWDISENYFRETTNAPIRVLTVASGTAPTNWRIANNYFVNCNAKVGASAANWISFGDANNLTWSKVVIEGNVAVDANSRMTSLFGNSGTGWTGALRIHNNIARDVTTGLVSLIAPTNLASCSGNIPEAQITQAIAAAGDTIIGSCRRVQFTCPGGTTVMSSAPTIADGYDGQELILINVDSADTIRLTDQGGLASSNLRLAAATIDLGPRDSIRLEYNASIGDWVQVGPLVTVI